MVGEKLSADVRQDQKEAFGREPSSLFDGTRYCHLWEARLGVMTR
jgi:hypothetical protein